MKNPRLSAFIAASLDGYIADDEGSLAWLENASGEGEDYGWKAFINSVDALAMGRTTYDYLTTHTDIWQAPTKPTFVFTHRPPEGRAGITFLDGEPVDARDYWAKIGLTHVYVDGGELISSFLDDDLIDELTLTIVPILLGSGTRLFHPLRRRISLKLTAAKPFPSGLLTLHFKRVNSEAEEEEVG